MQALDGADTNRANQIVVGPTLQATGDEHVFAIGDCASLLPDGHERPLPPTAQVATQQAEHLAKHLPAWLDGTPIPPFAFHDFGALVSISDYDAFGTLGQFGFFRGGFIQGRFAQFSHLMLYRRHQQALHGFQGDPAVDRRTDQRLRAAAHPALVIPPRGGVCITFRGKPT